MGHVRVHAFTRRVEVPVFTPGGRLQRAEPLNKSYVCMYIYIYMFIYIYICLYIYIYIYIYMYMLNSYYYYYYYY